MSKPNSPIQNRPYLLLAFGAICISFAPVFVKLIEPGSMGLTAIAFWRMTLGGLIFFALALVTKRKLMLNGRLLLWAALAGLFFTLDLGVWHRSIVYAGAGLSTILGNTQVFITAILSVFIFHERPGLRFYIAAVAAMGGVVLLVGVGAETTFSNDYLWGIIYGLLTGLFYACYLTTLKQAGLVNKLLETIVFIAWVCLFASGFLAIGTLIESGAFWPPESSAWVSLWSLALVVQVLGWLAIMKSLPKIEIARAGLVLLLQPTFAMLWGMLMFGEQLSLSQLLGGVITLFCIWYGSTYKAGSLREPALPVDPQK